MKDLLQKRIFASGVFKGAYLLLTFLTFNMMSSATATLKYCSYAVTAFGVLVLAVRLFYFKEYKDTRGIYLLIAFSVVSVISALLNFRYGGRAVLIENGKSFLWMAFCFFALYAYNGRSRKEDILKEFRVLSYAMMIYNDIAAVVGIYLMATGYRLLQIRNGTVVLGGFLWGRLWGVYTDPNHGAVLSAICILLSLYYIVRKAKGPHLIFHIFSILLSLIYIACSDSRTGMVGIAVGFGVAVYLFSAKKIPTFKKQALRYVLCIGLSLISAVSAFAVVKAQKQVVTVTSRWLSEGIFSKKETNAEDQSEKEEEDGIEIGREGDISEDISNRRFSIWGSAFELTAKAPFFGTSFRGIVPFAEEEAPETYLIHNDSGKFDCFHNSLLDILVSQGIVGFLLFAAFAVLVFLYFFKGLLKIKQKDNYLFTAMLFSILILIAVSSLFLSQIIFINSIGGIVFWIFLGYAMNYSRIATEEEEEICQA